MQEPTRRAGAVRAAGAGALAAIALAVSACSAALAPGAAAVDPDGDVLVEVAEVDALAAEFAEIAPEIGAPPQDRIVYDRLILALLLQEPVIRDTVADVGVTPASAAETRQGDPWQDVDLSDDLAELISLDLTLVRIQEAGAAQEYLSRVADLDVVVNPRYGDVSTANGVPQLVDATDPWLTTATTDAPDE